MKSLMLAMQGYVEWSPDIWARNTWATCSTGCPIKMTPCVYLDDNFGKYGPILTIFSVLQQEIYEAQKLSYFSHLTFIMLPLYLAKQTLMLVSMQIFSGSCIKTN